MSKIRLNETNEPDTPPSSKGDTYIDQADSKLKFKNDSGKVYDLTAGFTEELIWTIGDGQNLILSGTKGRRLIPRNLVIKGWRIYEASTTPITGSIQIDFLKGADFNTAVSIAGTEKVELVSQDNNSDVDLSTWTSSLSQGDFVWFHVESIAGVKKVIIILEVEKA